MFRRIYIDGYRTCERVDLTDLGAIVALVGQNGAGKSNILKGIRWAAKAATSADILPQMFDARGWKRQIQIKLIFVIETYEYEYTLKVPSPINVPGLEKKFEESLKVFEASSQIVLFNRIGTTVVVGRQELNIGMTGFTLPFIQSVLTEVDPIIVHAKRVVEFLKKVRYYPLDEQNEIAENVHQLPIIPQEYYDNWLTSIRGQGDLDDSIAMRLLNLYLERTDEFQIVQSHLGKSGLGLCNIHIATLPSVTNGIHSAPTTNNFYSVQFTPLDSIDDYPTLRGYGTLSLGTRRIVRLITSLVFDRSPVMLIEHPEDGIHRGLLVKLIELLKAEADPTQLFIASHSPIVLDRLKPEEIRLVTMNEGVTSVRPLSSKQLQIAHKHICEDLGLADVVNLFEQD